MFKLRNIYKIMLKIANFVSIAPQENHQKSGFRDFLQKTILIYGIVFISLYSCKIRYDSQTSESTRSTPLIIQFYLGEISEIIGLATMLITHKLYFKKNVWIIFYENIRLSELSNKRKMIISLLFVIITLNNVLILLGSVFFILTFNLNLAIDFLILATYTLIPNIQYYHKLIAVNFVTMVILEIRYKFIEARNELNSELLDIREVKKLIIEAYRGTEALKELFSYQFLTSLLQWLIFILYSLMGIIVFIKSNEKLISQAYIIQGCLLLVYNIFLISMGPFIVVFICDMVIYEVNNLSERCEELQKNYNYNSYEYCELESIERFLKNGSIQFSAAKFIEVSRSTCFSSIQVAATYFIALLQLYK